MATELFSVCGYTGWRSQAFPGYTVTCTFDGHNWCCDRDSIGEAEKAFYAAARRALLRKFLKMLGVNLAFEEGYYDGKD